MYYVTGWLNQRYKRQKETIFQRLEIEEVSSAHETFCLAASRGRFLTLPVYSRQQNCYQITINASKLNAKIRHPPCAGERTISPE